MNAEEIRTLMDYYYRKSVDTCSSYERLYSANLSRDFWNAFENPKEGEIYGRRRRALKEVINTLEKNYDKICELEKKLEIAKNE